MPNKPPVNPRVAAAKKAEAAYAALYNAGKVGPKNINKIKGDIAKKYGVYPIGKVN